MLALLHLGFDATERVFRLCVPRAGAGGPAHVTVDQVDETLGISRHHLVKVVHDLGRSAYLQTQRGVGGGFTLARPPDKIRVGDIVRLGEESEAVIDCMDKSGCSCRIFPSCRLRAVLDEASSAFFTVLDRYTLADLIERPSKIREVLQL